MIELVDGAPKRAQLVTWVVLAAVVLVLALMLRRQAQLESTVADLADSIQQPGRVVSMPPPSPGAEAPPE